MYAIALMASFFGVRLPDSYCAILISAFLSEYPSFIHNAFCVIPRCVQMHLILVLMDMIFLPNLKSL